LERQRLAFFDWKKDPSARLVGGRPRQNVKKIEEVSSRQIATLPLFERKTAHKTRGIFGCK
jgi:hypothetical protein